MLVIDGVIHYEPEDVPVDVFSGATLSLKSQIEARGWAVLPWDRFEQSNVNSLIKVRAQVEARELDLPAPWVVFHPNPPSKEAGRSLLLVGRDVAYLMATALLTAADGRPN
ncbi:hypothetical protein [Xanthobacter flavus]|uniref:hypothetical protein n=1 Tax=Xanthobacter flavus TaxID=281 RepID=UPI0037273506